jgi:protein-S-isoprenylcysteine O-methyltransferase Ste14
LNVLRHYNVVISIVCFCSFLWTLYGRVFNAPGAARRAPAVIRLLGPPFVAAHVVVLMRGQTGYGSALIGALMYTTSLLLFWSCASNRGAPRLSLVFSGEMPDHLRCDGPYRYVRHPFYCSYCLAWFSGAIASRSRWLFLSALSTATVYGIAARLEEDAFAASAMAPQYAVYRARTGMFFPRLPGLPGLLRILRLPGLPRLSLLPRLLRAGARPGRIT